MNLQICIAIKHCTRFDGNLNVFTYLKKDDVVVSQTTTKGKGQLVMCGQEPRDLPRLLQRTWRLSQILVSYDLEPEKEASSTTIQLIYTYIVRN